MGSTVEDRVWRHWRALKKRFAREKTSTNSNELWLTLARVHRMPVRKIKDIVNARRGPVQIPVFCCEDRCYVVRYVDGERNGERQWQTN